MTEEKVNRLKVKVAKTLFYNEMWGIISVEPVSISTPDFNPELNKWKNFIVRGNLPFRPEEKQELEIEITDIKSDPKYGNYYEIVRVHMEELNTVESQQRYLSAILSEHRAKLIIDAFPNSMIIDDVRDGKINLLSIKGIGASTEREIKSQIENNKDLGALMIETSDLNLTGRMLSRIIEKYGDSTTALAKVRDSLYNLCSISGISFKRVDEAALARGEDPTSNKRIRSYSHHYFDEIANQGHSWVNERTFLEQSLSDLNINASYIRKYMESEEGERYFYWQQGDKRISSMFMYENEKNVFKHLLRLYGKYEAPEVKDLDFAIQTAEESLGVKYADEQKKAIVEAIKYGVFILNGKGGVGKTLVIKGIVEVLEYLGLNYMSCALSGKASNVLKSRGIKSATIHRTFGIGMKEKKTSPVGITDVDTEEMGDVPEDGMINVYIIDETSMVNAAIFADVLGKIKSGAKVIFVGDSGQLSAIGHGDILRDLLKTKYFPTFELMQVHRQAQDSGIIEVAKLIREGKQIFNAGFQGKQMFGVNKDMAVFGYQDKDAIIKDFEKVLYGQNKKITRSHDLLDFQVVVAMKERGDLSSRSINILAQSIFNDLDKPFVSHGGYDYREGDKIIIKGNSYDIKYFKDVENYEDFKENGVSSDERDDILSNLPSDDARIEFLDSHPTQLTGDLFNGTVGIVVALEEVFDYEKDKMVKKLVIDLEGFGVKVFEQNELDSIELAYATTCHRLQGSTIKNVIVLLDYSAYSLLSLQWLYTAITRASQRCILMAQSAAVVKAISTDASGNRQTFLGDMIKNVRDTRGNIDKLVG